MSETPIQPALTPEQWTQLTADPYWWEYHGPQQGGWRARPELDSNRHGMAAACLYRQPCGFTKDEAELLADVAREYPLLAPIAAKIQALLPPQP